MSQIIKFAVLVGLRPSECVEAVKLINSDKEAFEQYYDPVQQALLHYKFPKQFLRTTKKAYISFVTPAMLDIVQNLDVVPSYNAIRMTCYHKGIKCDLRYTRKIFASHLRNEGIQPEIVDMLQGRVSQSILTRHYLTPDSNLSSRILDSLYKLQRTISQ